MLARGNTTSARLCKSMKGVLFSFLVASNLPAVIFWWWGGGEETRKEMWTAGG